MVRTKKKLEECHVVSNGDGSSVDVIKLMSGPHNAVILLKLPLTYRFGTKCF